jgi:hypothetical protein
MDISAAMRVTLIETQTGKIVSDNSVTTAIQSWGMSDKEGGQTYWNFSTVSLAIQTATRKGVKFMVEDCGC